MCNVGEEKVVEVLLEGTSVEIAQVDDELVEVEDTFELCQPCVASSPYAPSRQERAEHNVTHCPFRSWCKHCVEGKAKNSPHYVDKSKDPESRVPIVSVDYAFMSNRGSVEQEYAEAKIMVIKDDKSKYVFSVPVPQKGIDDTEWAVRRFIQSLEFLGYTRCLIKCDQESSLKKVVQHVKTHLGREVDEWKPDQLGVENSPAYDSQANGAVERANQAVEGQVRTLKSALEARIGKRLMPDDCIMPWLIMHAGETLSHHQVGQDGKVAFQRLKGRKMRRHLAEFGERVMWQPLDQLKAGSMEPRFLEGVWLGIRPQSSEVIVGTNKGVFKTRTFRRIPENERWSSESITNVTGTPWKPTEFDDSDKLKIRIPGPEEPPVDDPHVRGEDGQPRNFMIYKRDLERYGYTPQCPGCYAAKHNKAHKSHNHQCRELIKSKLLADDEFSQRIHDHQLREDRWLAEQIEKSETTKVDETRAEGASDVAPEDKREVVDPMDTADFFREVDEANDAADGDDMVDMIDDAIALLKSMTKPPRIESSKVLLEVLRNANAMGHADVAEIYSPPRVTSLAEKYGMLPGFALDITVTDPDDGLPWNFDKLSKRKKAIQLIKTQSPKLLIGSPMCTAFSIIQGLNKGRMRPENWDKMRKHGKKHLKFACELYKIQHSAGRYFIHEHPDTANSWEEHCVQQVMNLKGVVTVKSHMCQFGMTSVNEEGDGLVKKPTRYMTNAPLIAEELERFCTGDHRHVHLLGGRAAKAAIYPPQLCEAILRGLKRQLIADGSISRNEKMLQVCQESWMDAFIYSFCEIDSDEEFIDDVSGLPLDPVMVRAARKEEIDVFRQHQVYSKVSIDEAWSKTNKAPIGVRWIDINKGDRLNPEYRSRLVAKEIKRDNREDMFAATPPLEAKKALFSLAATEEYGRMRHRSKMRGPKKLLFIDVKRAYFHAPVTRDVYVQLPDEDGGAGQCGKLNMSMYGTRDAASNWEAAYTDFHASSGFTPGISSPCAFYHQARDIHCVIHGDDFTYLGRDEDLDWLQGVLTQTFEIKIRGRLGPEKQDDKHMRILNRCVEWGPRGLKYEADPRHAEIIIRELGLEKSSSVISTPGAKEKIEDFENHEDEPLDGEWSTKFRRLIARANFLSIDRPDIQFAVKELSSGMAKPCMHHWNGIVRLGKFLKNKPRYIINYDYQQRGLLLNTFTDSDWAGELRTRKSTSGGMVCIGDHCVRSWASNQNVIALSSGEAEFYALVKGASVALGIKALLEDLGVKVRIRLITDASTGKAIAARRGLGKIRHLDTSQLWLQSQVQDGTIELVKIKNTWNTADLFTKHLSAPEIERILELMNHTYEEGRSPSAPMLNTLESMTMPMAMEILGISEDQ